MDPGAVGAILDVLHRTAELGRLWGESPPTRLRAGGIPARDLTRTARALAATEPATALLIEVAAAAGLVAADSQDHVGILPTSAFDAWLAQPPSEQHAALLGAWLAMPRDASPPPTSGRWHPSSRLPGSPTCAGTCWPSSPRRTGPGPTTR